MARGKHRRGSNPASKSRARHLAQELSWLRGRYSDQTKRFNTQHVDYCRLKQLERALVQGIGDPISCARQYSEREWHQLKSRPTQVTSEALAMAVALDQLAPYMVHDLASRLIQLGFLRLSIEPSIASRNVTITLTFPGPRLTGPLGLEA